MAGLNSMRVKNEIHVPEAVHIGDGTLPNGEEIQDFHYLDKMMIYTMNVCATQQLHRMIVKQQEVVNDHISRIEVLES